jgi:hypothetical protein
MVKIPTDLAIPSYQDKPRVRKAILRTIIQTLQTKTLELIYVGPQQQSLSDVDTNLEGVIVTVNVLKDGPDDYNLSQDMLLKRFKKELQFNSEHILIDNTTFDEGNYLRHIEIYIKSLRTKKSVSAGYTFSTSSGSYAYDKAS